MRIRLLAVAFLAAVALAGCGPSSAPTSSPSAPSSSPVWPSPSVSASPPGGAVPRLPAPSGSASETISGTVSAGVEPHCLILLDATGSHVLIFHDPALRAAAPAGARVTLIGRSQPTMPTTCQQGVPFIVSAVRKK